jgi:hypothetical protein
MHRFENDLKLLLHTINVRDITDLNKVALNRSNKENVVSFALNMSKLLKSSHELLKSAAADLDSLKCEQLHFAESVESYSSAKRAFSQEVSRIGSSQQHSRSEIDELGICCREKQFQES